MTTETTETIEKPCSWHANGINKSTGFSEDVYCEVGPDGHDGSHIGDRTKDEYYRLLREWRTAKNRRESGNDQASKVRSSD